MNQTEKVLVIDLGDVYARAFLFKIVENTPQLIKKKKLLISLKTKEIIDMLTYSFRHEYDRLEIISERDKYFRDGVKAFSSWGTVFGVLVGNKEIQIEFSSFGRVVNSRNLQFGIREGMERMMVFGGLEYLKKWMQAITGRKDAPLNFLGNYSLYPTMNIYSEDSLEAVIGIMRFILNQVNMLDSIYFHQMSSSRSTMSKFATQDYQQKNRVLISGEIFSYFPNKQDLLLAIVDGLALEGIWEIYIDNAHIVPSLAVFGSEINYTNSEMGIAKLATVLVLNHQYNWGTALGEITIDVGLTENQVVQLKSGELIRIPLEDGDIGSIEFDLKPDVGIDQQILNAEIAGGDLGLIIDARGRPLPPLDDVNTFRKEYPNWRDSIN